MHFSTRGTRLVMALTTIMVLAPLSRADEPSMAVAKPGPEHAMLASGVGVWDAEMKMYMGGPGSPPTISKGVETVSMLPGGLWLFDDFNGEFAGAPFHGRGQTGYDPKKKKFIGSWVDSMSPALSTFEGTYDAKTKTLTMIGDVDDPATGKTMKEKMVTEYKDENSHVFTMYINSAETRGTDFKVMEIVYKKRK